MGISTETSSSHPRAGSSSYPDVSFVIPDLINPFSALLSPHPALSRRRELRLPLSGGFQHAGSFSAFPPLALGADYVPACPYVYLTGA